MLEFLSRDNDEEEEFLMDGCNRNESDDEGTTAAVTMDRRDDDGVVKASAPLGKMFMMA